MTLEYDKNESNEFELRHRFIFGTTANSMKNKNIENNQNTIDEKDKNLYKIVLAQQPERERT